MIFSIISYILVVLLTFTHQQSTPAHNFTPQSSCASFPGFHFEAADSYPYCEKKKVHALKTCLFFFSLICFVGFSRLVEAMTDNSITRSAPADDEQLPREMRIRHLKLYQAALKADWDLAKDTYDEYEDDISVGLSKEGDTALHIAAAAKHTDFVKELVRRMGAEDLSQKNNAGNTALCLVAESGNVKLAKLMMKKYAEEKNENLAMIRDNNEMLPLHKAASLRHKHMVEFLYQETRGDLDHKDRIELLVALINTNLYDVASGLELLSDYPELATARDENRETALHALARKPLTSSNFANQNQRGILRTCFNLVSGAKYVDNKNQQAEALHLVEQIWKQVILRLSDWEISELIGYPWRLIFVAAEQGNIEFLSILIRQYPDLLRKVNEEQYSIFQIAVLNRQEDVFKLIYEIGSFKDLIVMFEDSKGNNILHLAGMLAPSNRLNIVSGAALQLQRELLWFQEVTKVVQSLYAEAKNKDKLTLRALFEAKNEEGLTPIALFEAKNRKGLTPRALFTEQHEDLREKGEKWMKDTATSCMLVATLIATVVFAAALTVPGGNKGDTGLPNFLQKISFKIFAIADAISLVSSSTSIVNFLAILTSRYAEEDFLRSLPRKLLIGLTTLFISIAAMMVVFSATFFIIFNGEMKWIAGSVTLIASTPVIVFICQQYRLFSDIVRSTYVSDSLFQPGKNSLFLRDGNTTDCHESKERNADSTISTIV